MQYQFQIDITVGGTPFKAGTIIDEADLHPGFLTPLKRMRQVAPYVPPPVVTEADDADDGDTDAETESAEVASADPKPESARSRRRRLKRETKGAPADQPSEQN